MSKCKTYWISETSEIILTKTCRAPPYSDLLAFTDEGGDDEYLQSTVINLAQDQKSKINIIWTDVLKRLLTSRPSKMDLMIIFLDVNVGIAPRI